MIYPQITGEPNFILIGISAVFGLVLIIMVYYIVVSRSSSPGRLYSRTLTDMGAGKGAVADMAPVSGNAVPAITNPVPINSGGYYSPAPPTTSATPGTAVSNPNIKQVFNIKNNIYTLEDAPAVCGAFGAELASIEQLINSHRSGANWCNVGWTNDGLAAYPIQKSFWDKMQGNTPDKRGICGQPGINLVRNDPNLLYGVNCYGVKPEPKKGEKVKETVLSDTDVALNAKIAEFQKNLENINVAPWNNDMWSQ